jgi:hypothetical protein
LRPSETLFFAVDLQNHHFNALATFTISPVIDAPPAHVGDSVVQAVESIEVDERAEVGEVLDDPFPSFADAHVGQQRPAFLVALVLDQLASREHDVLPILVDLDNLELERLADIIVEIAWRDDVDLRGRKKCLNTNVDGESTFDLRADFTFNRAAFAARAANAVPVFLLLGLFV